MALAGTIPDFVREKGLPVSEAGLAAPRPIDVGDADLVRNGSVQPRASPVHLRTRQVLRHAALA
jgi:hypothetical protein